MQFASFWTYSMPSKITSKQLQKLLQIQYKQNVQPFFFASICWLLLRVIWVEVPLSSTQKCSAKTHLRSVIHNCFLRIQCVILVVEVLQAEIWQSWEVLLFAISWFWGRFFGVFVD
jgi:hypothetical protein